MSKKRDPRTVERVLMAASEVVTDSLREAAILGGIVRSLLDTGHLRISFVRHYAPQVIGFFAVNGDLYRERVDTSTPTDQEIKRVASRFLDKYDPGAAERVAA